MAKFVQLDSDDVDLFINGQLVATIPLRIVFDDFARCQQISTLLTQSNCVELNLSGMEDSQFVRRFIWVVAVDMIKLASKITLRSEKQLVENYINYPHFPFSSNPFAFDPDHTTLPEAKELTIHNSYADKRLIYILSKMPNLTHLTILAVKPKIKALNSLCTIIDFAVKKTSIEVLILPPILTETQVEKITARYDSLRVANLQTFYIIKDDLVKSAAKC